MVNTFLPLFTLQERRLPPAMVVPAICVLLLPHTHTYNYLMDPTTTYRTYSPYSSYIYISTYYHLHISVLPSAPTQLYFVDEFLPGLLTIFIRWFPTTTTTYMGHIPVYYNATYLFPFIGAYHTVTA